MDYTDTDYSNEAERLIELLLNNRKFLLPAAEREELFRLSDRRILASPKFAEALFVNLLMLQYTGDRKQVFKLYIQVFFNFQTLFIEDVSSYEEGTALSTNLGVIEQYFQLKYTKNKKNNIEKLINGTITRINNHFESLLNSWDSEDVMFWLYKSREINPLINFLDGYAIANYKNPKSFKREIDVHRRYERSVVTGIDVLFNLLSLPIESKEQLIIKLPYPLEGRFTPDIVFVGRDSTTLLTSVCIDMENHLLSQLIDSPRYDVKDKVFEANRESNSMGCLFPKAMAFTQKFDFVLTSCHLHSVLFRVASAKDGMSGLGETDTMNVGVDYLVSSSFTDEHTDFSRYTDQAILFCLLWESRFQVVDVEEEGDKVYVGSVSGQTMAMERVRDNVIQMANDGRVSDESKTSSADLQTTDTQHTMCIYGATVDLQVFAKKGEVDDSKVLDFNSVNLVFRTTVERFKALFLTEIRASNFDHHNPGLKPYDKVVVKVSSRRLMQRQFYFERHKETEIEDVLRVGFKRARNELRVLRKIQERRHKVENLNVPHLYCSGTVLEYDEGKDCNMVDGYFLVTQFIKNDVVIDNNYRIRGLDEIFIKRAIEQLELLSLIGIRHLDLRTRNLLIDKAKKQVYFIDFELAKVSNHEYEVVGLDIKIITKLLKGEESEDVNNYVKPVKKLKLAMETSDKS